METLWTFFNIIGLDRLCQRTVRSKLHDNQGELTLKYQFQGHQATLDWFKGKAAMDSTSGLTARTAPISFLRPGDWRHKKIKVRYISNRKISQNTWSYLAIISASDSEIIRVCRQMGLEACWNQSGQSPLGNIVNQMHGPLVIVASTGIVTGQTTNTWY
jgi:hypothetical protein